MAETTFREGLWEAYKGRLWDIHALVARALIRDPKDLQVLEPSLLSTPLLQGWTSDILFRGAKVGQMETAVRGLDATLPLNVFMVQISHPKLPYIVLRESRILSPDTPAWLIEQELQELSEPRVLKYFADEFSWLIRAYLGPKEWAPRRAD